MTKPILFILTGGTIGAKAYGETPPEFASFEPEESLEQNRVYQAVKAMPGGEGCVFYQLCNLDSKEVTESHLEHIARLIREQGYERVIITHGTDRMPENSRALAEKLGTYPAEAGVKVIMTGSMKPLANGPESDGFENLRESLDRIDNLAPRVHIMMHGQFLNPAKTMKDMAAQRMFER